MKIVVLKFGGSSVGTIEKIKKIADIIHSYKKRNYKIIVVSSAMSGVTNDLVQKSKKISKNFADAEYDVLVSSGEQVACSLIAGRLIHKGLKSRSWLAWQIPIFTKGIHKNSRINLIYKNRILKYLRENGIPIITGFQGINNQERITTIGRGGSDASAIMLAKFFKAEKSGKTHFAAARRHTPHTHAASGVKFSENNFLQARNSRTVRRSVTQQNIIFVQNLICNNF